MHSRGDSLCYSRSGARSPDRLKSRTSKEEEGKQASFSLPEGSCLAFKVLSGQLEPKASGEGSPDAAESALRCRWEQGKGRELPGGQTRICCLLASPWLYSLGKGAGARPYEPLWPGQVTGGRGGERSVSGRQMGKCPGTGAPICPLLSFPLPSDICPICLPMFSFIFYLLPTLHGLLPAFKNYHQGLIGSICRGTSRESSVEQLSVQGDARLSPPCRLSFRICGPSCLNCVGL